MVSTPFCGLHLCFLSLSMQCTIYMIVHVYNVLQNAVHGVGRWTSVPFECTLDWCLIQFPYILKYPHLSDVLASLLLSCISYSLLGP